MRNGKAKTRRLLKNLRQLIDRCTPIHYHGPMAEVEINKSMHVKVNDKEHMAFKLLCVREGTDMSVVIRGLMREYMASKKGKRK